MYVCIYIYSLHIICVSNTESPKKPFAAPLCFQQVQQVRQVRQREASIIRKRNGSQLVIQHSLVNIAIENGH